MAEINTTSLSIFDKTLTSVPMVGSVDACTSPKTTGLSRTPSALPFVPVHISTPHHCTPAPSVHTVSAYLSPIISSKVVASNLAASVAAAIQSASESSSVPSFSRSQVVDMVPVTRTSAPLTTFDAVPVSTVSHDELVSTPASVVRQLFTGPSSQQLAARQVVPSDLPTFSGDPIEWPLFLSSFSNSTEMCGYTDGENMMRLQRCLKGKALEAVRYYLMHPSSVPLIMETLKTLYGRPELIVTSLLAKVRSTPPPKQENLETLINFGLACKNLCGHLRAAGLDDHLSNPILLQELVNKLPASIKLNWALYRRQQPTVDLTTFGNYMNEIVTAASEVTFTFDSDVLRLAKAEKMKPNEKRFVNNHTVYDVTDNSSSSPNTLSTGESLPKPCPICQTVGHKARDCYTFYNMTLSDRWKMVQERRLCRRCLIAHGKFPCKASMCGEKGCEDRHHKLLHPGNPIQHKSSATPRFSNTVTVHHQRQQSTLFRIIPVTLYGNGKSVYTYAFLDDGFDTTLVESRIANELGVTGEIHPLCLQWTNGIDRTEEDSRTIKLEISGKGKIQRHPLKTRTVKNLNLPIQSMDYPEICKRFPYLEGLPVQSYQSANPAILIGLDNSHLSTMLKCRIGSRFEPIAAKSKLGWTVYGSIVAELIPKINYQFHICARFPDQELHDLVKEFFNVEKVEPLTTPLQESDEELRAKAILEQTTVRTPSGRFQTGLLWKYDVIDFPNSRPMAEKRLKCLERRLATKPELYDKVREQLKLYQTKGYSYKVSQQELQAFDVKRTWFLPLNVVINPKKPSKVRLVWDAAAKVQGQSLNSALLPGPDLLTPLPSVLSSFREFRVAITGDISEMFHQIIIRPEDRSAQLFLWRDNPTEQFDVFAMKVATFGSTCSPSAAQFVKNRNAMEFANRYPQAANAIIKHHYVDDFVRSEDSTEKAIELALQVKEVHAKAGFHIRNWLSNDKEVLARVGEQNVELSKSFAVSKASSNERVLGMIWKPDQDVFVFQGLFQDNLQPFLQGIEIPTKRQVLRIVMSIFDPLGLIAVFWERWTKLLSKLDKIQIPRCYFQDATKEVYNTLELHIFVDASEEALAAVAYFRIVDDCEVRCALVSAKTKVASLKPTSIPRLELQAAVMGVKLARAIEKNHTIKITRRVFWSDSSTVLSWLRSDQRRFRQYVAFRVTEILENSQVEEWRWIPSRYNVADEATKWGKGPTINCNSRWFQAPAHLYQDPELWPKQELRIPDTLEELRSVHVHRQVVTSQLLKFERFSKWERLIRAVGYALRFAKLINPAKQLDKRSEWLSQDELTTAEIIVFKEVQQAVYEDEINLLARNLQLPTDKQHKLERTSKICKLSPFLDTQGVLRMESRILEANYLPLDFKNPIILPKGHPGTDLLIDWYHRKFNHQHTETAVNEMRQRFYVSDMRTSFKRIRKVCQYCKVYKAGPSVPKMAPLPSARTTAYVRPFSYVGLDYFGPVLIKQARSEVKRWVALFTCLTIRAIHLEVVYNLSTESCKMAIRRFVARRGAPIEIFSDQGTNFVGASKQLKQELQQINNNLAATFTNETTHWRFNPPSAPHMGGCWERMVRSVKYALSAMSIIKKPNDETFLTLLVEAESLVNSRPLTYLPIESETHAALTPNCFLMLSTSGVNQPARQLVDKRAAITSNWNICQQLLDQFWCRWIWEYLPTIAKRTKWFSDCRPIQPGDIVVVIDENLRNGWTRGRVLRVFTGRDKRVRSAEVKTATGVFHRPATKLAVLEISGTAGVNSEQYGSGYVPNSVGDKGLKMPKGVTNVTTRVTTRTTR
ncbi:uncharacterized protein LOC128739932 [Sabethes cyaneus]|uniref:uncharacterized protein LOC128739932 n=1 Tax=Sabethes cyaneus TaxID=53552 RepID=UPI00237DA4F7|nr:uncharacterized protein LOC128739932 [Sabethes cyaneus]